MSGLSWKYSGECAGILTVPLYLGQVCGGQGSRRARESQESTAIQVSGSERQTGGKYKQVRHSG